MRLNFNDSERAFAEEVRAFLAEHLTPKLRRSHALSASVAAEPEIGLAWLKALADKG